MSEAQSPPLPDQVIEEIMNLTASLGEARPEGLAYVRTTERQALQLALGHIPYPADRPGLDDSVYLVSLRRRFYPPHGSATARKRSGSFLRLIIDAATYRRRALSVGDEPRDLRSLGEVGLD